MAQVTCCLCSTGWELPPNAPDNPHGHWFCDACAAKKNAAQPSIAFWEPCNPPKTTAQKTARYGQGRFYKDAKAEEAMATYHAIFSPHRPAKPLEGPLYVYVTLKFPLNKKDSATKADREWLANHNGELLHTGKPDLDNASKFLLDALRDLGFFRDDSQVCSLQLKKYRSATPGVMVRIGEMER